MCILFFARIKFRLTLVNSTTILVKSLSVHVGVCNSFRFQIPPRAKTDAAMQLKSKNSNGKRKTKNYTTLQDTKPWTWRKYLQRHNIFGRWKMARIVERLKEFVSSKVKIRRILCGTPSRKLRPTALMKNNIVV